MRLGWIAMLMAGLVATANAAGCATGVREDRSDEHRIVLKTVQPTTAFYYRVDHYGILIDAGTFTQMLQIAVDKYGTSSEEALLKDVRLRASESPQQYMDLFAILLKHPLLHFRIEGLLADALESGDAAIIDAWAPLNDPGRFLPMVVMTKIPTKVSSARRFCTPDGVVLLRFTDESA
jgi:hypothetical protein